MAKGSGNGGRSGGGGAVQTGDISRVPLFAGRATGAEQIGNLDLVVAGVLRNQPLNTMPDVTQGGRQEPKQQPWYGAAESRAVEFAVANPGKTVYFYRKRSFNERGNNWVITTKPRHGLGESSPERGRAALYSVVYRGRGRVDVVAFDLPGRR